MVPLGNKLDLTREYFQVEQDYTPIDAGEDAEYLV